MVRYRNRRRSFGEWLCDVTNAIVDFIFGER